MLFPSPSRSTSPGRSPSTTTTATCVPDAAGRLRVPADRRADRDEDVLDGRRARPRRPPRALAHRRGAAQQEAEAVQPARRDAGRVRPTLRRRRRRARRRRDGQAARQVRDKDRQAADRPAGRRRPADLLHTQRRAGTARSCCPPQGRSSAGCSAGASPEAVLGSVLGKAGTAAGRRSRTAASGDRLRPRRTASRRSTTSSRISSSRWPTTSRRSTTKWDAVADDVAPCRSPWSAVTSGHPARLVWLPVS